MLIITDLRIHLPPPPTGTPPSRRRRMENTIDYQIIIFLINFTVKFEEEPNRRQEKVCVSNLNFAFFKKEQKGKEQKERDKSRNPAGAIYCIPTEQNSFSVVIHT